MNQQNLSHLIYRHTLMHPVRQLMVHIRRTLARYGRKPAETYEEELKRQSEMLLIPGLLLSFIWLPFLYLDFRADLEHAAIVATLRILLSAFAIAYALALSKPSLRRNSMYILEWHAYYHLGAAAVIAGLDTQSLGPHSSLLVLLVAPCLLPVRFRSIMGAVLLSAFLFFAVSFSMGVDFSHVKVQYRAIDVVAAAVFSLLFLFLTDAVRQRGWMNGRKAHLRNLRIQQEIRERRKAEKTVLEKEVIASHFFEVSPAGMVVVDADTHHILRCNTAFLSLVGYDTAEIEGHPGSHTFAKIVDELFDRTHLEKPSYRRQTQIITRSGGMIEVIKNSQLSSINGRDVYIQSYIDVSEQQRALYATEQASEYKSEFLDSLSKRIRTAMNMIISMAQLGLEREPEPWLRDCLVNIKHSAQELLDSFNNLLDISRMETRQLEMEKKPFDLREVIRGVVELAELRLVDKPVELLVDIDPGLFQCYSGDSMRIGQVLSNLVSNAIRHTEQGEIIIQIRQRQNENAENIGEFTVSDTGNGMDETALEKLRQQLTQADHRRIQGRGETGLGLVVSQYLVQLMGGSMEVESEWGEGTRFRVEIPLSAMPEEKPVPATSVSALKDLRVLVVDDNATARDIAVKMLRAMRFRVEAVESGEAAIAAVENQGEDAYRVILLDWKLPAMDGIETGQQLLATGSVKGSLVLITSFGQESLHRRAMRSGFSGYLTKPLNASVLLDTIQRLFGQKDAL